MAQFEEVLGWVQLALTWASKAEIQALLEGLVEQQVISWDYCRSFSLHCLNNGTKSRSGVHKRGQNYRIEPRSLAIGKHHLAHRINSKLMIHELHRLNREMKSTATINDYHCNHGMELRPTIHEQQLNQYHRTFAKPIIDEHQQHHWMESRLLTTDEHYLRHRINSIPMIEGWMEGVERRMEEMDRGIHGGKWTDHRKIDETERVEEDDDDEMKEEDEEGAEEVEEMARRIALPLWQHWERGQRVLLPLVAGMTTGNTATDSSTDNRATDNTAHSLAVCMEEDTEITGAGRTLDFHTDTVTDCPTDNTDNVIHPLSASKKDDSIGIADAFLMHDFCTDNTAATNKGTVTSPHSLRVCMEDETTVEDNRMLIMGTGMTLDLCMDRGTDCNTDNPTDNTLNFLSESMEEHRTLITDTDITVDLYTKTATDSGAGRETDSISVCMEEHSTGVRDITLDRCTDRATDTPPHACSVENCDFNSTDVISISESTDKIPYVCSLNCSLTAVRFGNTDHLSVSRTTDTATDNTCPDENHSMTVAINRNIDGKADNVHVSGTTDTENILVKRHMQTVSYNSDIPPTDNLGACRTTDKATDTNEYSSFLSSTDTRPTDNISHLLSTCTGEDRHVKLVDNTNALSLCMATDCNTDNIGGVCRVTDKTATYHYSTDEGTDIVRYNHEGEEEEMEEHEVEWEMDEDITLPCGK